MTATSVEGVGAGIGSEARIVNGKVTSAALQANSVATASIVDLAVTTGKIDDLAVTAGKIGAAAVTTAKINSGAVTQPKVTYTGLAVYQAAGRNGAGAITTTGTTIGDRVVAIINTTGNTAAIPGTTFEATVTVANQIQQSSATDLSASRYAFVVVPAAA